ncbi:c-type cytochrome biogenesis protein CcmI [Ramlibacter sp.]|uniref:c-type cytochrome biogenesis protein CcmI n=1 Tax=Ramlibacter sp. TaxID=1917967 RepID=UPI003D10AACC
MTGFVIGAVVAVLVVLALLLRPLLRKPSPEAAAVSARQINADAYREALARLDRDLAEGTISAEDHAQSRAELQKRALEEVRDEPAGAAPKARAAKATLATILVAVPIGAAALYMVLGEPRGLGGDAMSASRQQEMVAQAIGQFRAQLEANPTDYKGWVLLAHTYRQMGQLAESAKAFERAGNSIDNSAGDLATYAEVLASSSGNSFEGKPTLLLQKALKADPAHQTALWLTGVAALGRSDAETATAAWGTLLKQVPPESTSATELTKLIALAKERGAQKAAGPASAAGTGSGAPATSAKSAALSPAAAGATVSGTVDIDASVKSKMQPNDVLMVIARPVGQRMPVAVLKVPADKLPMQFTLDDSLAMSPQARISGLTEVQVEARISKTGQARAEPGDLASPPQTVKVGARAVALKVDTVVR